MLGQATATLRGCAWGKLHLNSPAPVWLVTVTWDWSEGWDQGWDQGQPSFGLGQEMSVLGGLYQDAMVGAVGGDMVR